MKKLLDIYIVMERYRVSKIFQKGMFLKLSFA